jgi:release factor glutamine methyltransferase
LTLADLLRETRQALAALPDAALDARLLVEHFTETSRADFVLRPDRNIATDTVEAIHAALARRLAGEPVHRILGWREFYGLRLKLSAETLEPRPDTEVLVDTALPYLRSAASHGPCRILDLGTGTGAIALALLSQIPTATALAADISEDALSTARENAAALGLADRFETARSNWFSTVHGKFHGIVSNPPYISTNEFPTLAREVRDFDPKQALDGGADGLDAYRAIAEGAADHLEQDAIIAVEIGFRQRDDVTALFERAGYRLVKAERDLGGNDRVLVFEVLKTS